MANRPLYSEAHDSASAGTFLVGMLTHRTARAVLASADIGARGGERTKWISACNKILGSRGTMEQQYEIDWK